MQHNVTQQSNSVMKTSTTRLKSNYTMMLDFCAPFLELNIYVGQHLQMLGWLAA